MEYYIIVLVLCVVVLYFLWRFTTIKKAKLSQEQLKYFAKMREGIQNSSSSPKEKVIDYDKLYHKILLGAGYKGDFGEILKSEPIVVHNLDRVWTLHKVRNKLVHELEPPRDVSLVQTAHNYSKEIITLLRNLA